MAVPKIISDFETQISSAISIGSTSFTILSVTDDDGNTIPDGKYYFTIDSGSSNKEYVVGTLTGATKTVASVSNVNRQGTETSGTVRTHRVGANIKITDFATYKNYMDETSIAGASNATTGLQGLVELATQAEVDAGTATGGTGASLVVTPATMRSHLYHDYVADAGSTDAYAITVVPAITAYATGQEFTFKANTANTGACTLNVCSLGAITIKKNYNEDLVTGDIVANQIVKVVYDGTNMQLVNTLPSSIPIVRTYLNADSPATWTKPTGLKYVIVEVQAGGGGGGACTTNDNKTGGGGGAGGYSKKTIIASSLGVTETVTIGAKGAGGTAGSNPGSTGGTSSFGAHASATGGAGGSTNRTGGAGGTGSGGDINASGATGGTGSIPNNPSGAGASSMFGGGGLAIITDGAGNNATGYGAGGGGAYADSSSSAVAGGNGSDGIVIVTEYY